MANISGALLLRSRMIVTVEVKSMQTRYGSSKDSSSLLFAFFVVTKSAHRNPEEGTPGPCKGRELTNK